MINFKRIKLLFIFSMFILMLTYKESKSQTLCTKAGTDQIEGVKDGFRYELWNQNAQGTACMTVGAGALFSGEWNGIFNYLARRGLGYDQTQEHQEVGTFFSTYNCNYNPTGEEGGNSYLSIYGWTVEPLVEYYIVEDWRNWIPSMDQNAKFKGELIVDGSIYDIYENTRFNQPSIFGTKTFQQYFSIRRTVRNSGTINITNHFEKWESLGMELGKLYEVSFVVEGFKNSGNFEFTELDIFVNKPSEVSDKQNDQASFRIFPNPNQGEITIQLDDSFQDAKLVIYDNLGQRVYSKSNLNQNTLDVSNLKHGIYIVSIDNNHLNYKTNMLVL